jgi:hypothetical protein
MPSQHEAGVLGDWSGFRGAEYHLAYAIWLLLTDRATWVKFYDGNDLRAAPPPVLDDSEDGIVGLQGAEGADTDLWFQLKSSEKSWTTWELLQKNLLVNFLLNALESRGVGRQFEVRLISQAEVRSSDVLNFAGHPENHPKHSARLDEIVEKVSREWSRHRPQARVPDRAELRGLALDLLKKLARTQPVKLSQLQQEIVDHLRSEYYDEELAREIAFSLRGALIHDASVRPVADAPTYDAGWLSTVSAYRKKAIGPVLTNPPLACRQAIDRAAPDDWNPARYAPRPQLEDQLEQFMSGGETIFVLLGSSGAGKSWAVTHWCLNTLDGCIRLLARGEDFGRFHDLAPLLEAYLGPMKDRNWESHHFADWFSTEAERLDQGPPVLIVDDLRVGTDSPRGTRQDLSRLVRQCRERGIKLVVTCQEQVWVTNDVGAAVPVNELFMPVLSDAAVAVHPNGSGQDKETDILSSGTRARQDDHRAKSHYSTRLNDLDAAELRGVLDRLLPGDQSADLALRLEDPLYGLLRNPYLLTLYLAGHDRADAEGAPPSVDALLDRRLQDLLRPLARELNWSVFDVEDALDPLWEAIWMERAGGLSSLAAAHILDTVFPGRRGEAVLSALRQSGVLTVAAPVIFTEPLVGERLFARRLVSRFAAPGSQGLVDTLRPSTDVGTVLALLRGAAHEPARLVQDLLARDATWHSTVTAGLAQGSSEDYSVLAFLSVLARPLPPRIADADACDALGRLAARGERARQWVESMYLSARPFERLRGQRALRAAMRLAPGVVAGMVRARLNLASGMPAFHSTDKQKRSKWLDGALDPLAGVRDEVGARIVSEVLDELPAGLRDDPALREDLHEGRAVATLQAGEVDFEHVLQQLRSEGTQERIDAARMARTIVPERAEVARDAIIARIREEHDVEALLLVMWAAYHVMDVAADELMEALESRRWFEMPEPSPAAALAFALAAELAARFPHRVFRFLPRGLDDCSPERRAFLSEIFAYAWWQCSLYVPQGRGILEALLESNLEEIPEELKIFAMRGSVVAQLALVCMESRVAGGVDGQMGPYHGAMLTGLLVHVERLVERHADLLAGSEALKAVLLECIREEDRVNTVPPWHWLTQARWVCAAKCAEMLVAMVCAASDPLPALRALSDVELALQATRRLLDEGRRDGELIAFARQVCERTDNPKSMETALERSRCLAHLAAGNEEPVRSLREYLELVKYQFGTDHRAIGFAKVIDVHLDQLFLLLEDAVREPDDLPLLYLLEDHARSWQAHLIGRVHARMFDSRPISPEEARELCDQMLTGIEALPASPLQHEYALVYGAISARLESRVPHPLPAPRNDTIFGRSHALAIELLAEPAPYVMENGVSWLADAITDVRGWWQTGRYNLSEGSFGDGGGNHLMYPFPAVRLAAVAVGSAFGESDACSDWMKERADGHLALKHPNFVLAHNFQGDPEQWDSIIDELAAFAERTPRHAEAWYVLGTSLGRRGRLDEAEQVLETCLALPSCGQDTRASAWYDLACVHARQGREEECQEALVASDSLRPIDQQWLEKDEDFVRVRELPWFQDLLGRTAS